jgi:hypothetical protein
VFNMKTSNAWRSTSNAEIYRYASQIGPNFGFRRSTLSIGRFPPKLRDRLVRFS